MIRNVKSILFWVMFFFIGMFLIPTSLFAATVEYDFQTSVTGGLATGVSSGDRLYSAQKFTATANADTVSLYVNLSKYNSPSNNLVVAIESDSGGSPSGTVIASSTVSNGSVASGISCGSYSQIYIATTTASLVSGTSYWITFKQSGTPSGSSWYYVCNNTGSPVMKSYASGAWANYGSEMMTGRIYFTTSGGGGGGTTTSTSTEATSAEAIIFASLPLIFVATFFMFFYLFIIV